MCLHLILPNDATDQFFKKNRKKTDKQRQTEIDRKQAENIQTYDPCHMLDAESLSLII